ncbi:hypothetical protein [Spirosoma endbachense]|uniref:Uncharacterized protein n=1 Tax=Spirosoma endbachense TaxID=2666025 RepID=A0A6P1W8C0_9BACT|nr:hypothetical protein [Spirosoma endbachense]QHW00809.1 hypothetical protein GJR95_39845 [Spirosoma endbachense]
MFRTRFYLYFLCVAVSMLAFTCVREYPATAPYTPPTTPTNPGNLPPQTQPVAQNRLFIGNDKIRLAIDLNMGGAINYLSEAGSSENMVNNYDWGRQLQTALYGGPFPYSVNGKDPVYFWRNLGWNPVQTGDYYNHPARIVSYQQGQNSLYVKTIPLIWPLFDEPADCFMEHWIELQGNTAHVKIRSTINRADTAQYDGRTQEMPCVYLNAPWYRMVTYTGTQPFTNGPVTEISKLEMLSHYTTENWTALLNDEGRGVGLYQPNQFRFKTNGFGSGHVGKEFDVTSYYMNADPFLQIDHNGVYEFEYTLILGTLADIRQYAYAQPRPETVPNFKFTKDRQGWFYYNVTDKGWPIQNELNVNWQRADTSKANFRVCSPFVYWKPTDVPKIYIQAAFTTKATTARIVWRKPEDYDFLDGPDRQIDFPIVGDGKFRTYEVNLSGHSGWSGLINQICLLNPQNNLEKGSNMRLKSVTVAPVQ